MAIRVSPGYKEQLVRHVLIELAARKDREENSGSHYQSDICDWGEHNFYIPNPGDPIVLPLHQKAVLRFFFTRNTNRHFPFQTLMYSAIKKSGKSTIAGMIGRYFAETQTRYGEIYTIGNDLEQAKERSFKEIVRSLELTPGYEHNKTVLPGRWFLNKLSLKCILTGSAIKAVAVDAAGEAGGQPALTIWTELWGAENTEAKRFWDEMTPIPTIPDSLRLVETYAGYDGESELLHGLYDVGLAGHQLTAGELAEKVCRPNVEGETFDDFVKCWWETRGDPDVLVPVWANPEAGLAMYWDSGMVARRMPWQHMPIQDNQIVVEGTPGNCEGCNMPVLSHYIGIPSEQYYNGQEAILLPQAFRRLHLNEWVGAESQFVPMESWDACANEHSVEPLMPDKKTMVVLGVDAAVTGDCFGIVAVNRCPNDSNCVDIRAIKKWDPESQGGTIDLEKPETFIREACKVNNIVQIAFDPYQLESTAQRLRKDGIAWLSPFNQAGDRLRADSQLYDMIISKRVHYSHAEGCPKATACNCWIAPLREHIANSNAKVQKDEDSKLRIVKKASGKKIDLTVSLSMAVARAMFLLIG